MHDQGPKYDMDLILFLVADMQLYKMDCSSLGLSTHPSIGLSVCWSVMIESESGKLHILNTFCVCGGWGVDGGWMPLPTCLQQYWDPASLVWDFNSLLQIKSNCKWMHHYHLGGSIFRHPTLSIHPWFHQSAGWLVHPPPLKFIF